MKVRRATCEASPTSLSPREPTRSTLEESPSVPSPMDLDGVPFSCSRWPFRLVRTLSRRVQFRGCERKRFSRCSRTESVSDQLPHAFLRARALPGCPKIPAEGSGPSGPSAASLCWSRSGGAFAPILGLEELQSALGFAKALRVTHPHTALFPTFAAERQHRSLRRDS